MAANAMRAVELGAKAIDINFGCPSKTVNKHDGGASLLQYPCRIKSIVKTVRETVPAQIPVSVKMRLGWEKMEDIYHNAVQAYEAGASWLTIHARTKKQGYAPPAYWKYIGEVQKLVGIPVVANGEIWSVEDFLKCQEQTGAIHFMIGRGVLADPTLAIKIAKLLGINTPSSIISKNWEPLLHRFNQLNLPDSTMGPTAILGRMKQWLKFAHLRDELPWFDEIKKTQTAEGIF